MKRYLVSGGAGFIGSHLADAILAQGHEVVVLDNFSSGKRANLASTQALTVIEGDIRNPAQWEYRVGRVDAIVHLAALISGYDSLSDPDAYEDVNLRGLQRTIEFAVATGVKRIVFASSSTVYGNQEGVALTEITLPDPLTVYALTKLAGEHLLRLYGQMHGFTHCSLRLFNVYGPRQATDHPYANVTCKFSHAAANGLPVKLYGDGEQSRDFIYVGDVVRAILAVLDESSQSLYNVGTGSVARINDLLTELGEISGAPLVTEQCGPWLNDIRSIQADPSRSKNKDGSIPPTILGSQMGFDHGPAGLRAVMTKFPPQSTQVLRM